MSLDSWALGCPGSGNILFQRRMSSRQVSELLVPGFGRPVLLCQGRMPRA